MRMSENEDILEVVGRRFEEAVETEQALADVLVKRLNSTYGNGNEARLDNVFRLAVAAVRLRERGPLGGVDDETLGLYEALLYATDRRHDAMAAAEEHL